MPAHLKLLELNKLLESFGKEKRVEVADMLEVMEVEQKATVDLL